MITIDKNIPMPTGPKSEKFPLEELEIGDSFLLQRGKNDQALVYAIIKKRKMDIKIVTRKQKDGQYRVWRVK